MHSKLPIPATSITKLMRTNIIVEDLTRSIYWRCLWNSQTLFLSKWPANWWSSHLLQNQSSYLNKSKTTEIEEMRRQTTYWTSSITNRTHQFISYSPNSLLMSTLIKYSKTMRHALKWRTVRNSWWARNLCLGSWTQRVIKFTQIRSFKQRHSKNIQICWRAYMYWVYYLGK